MKMRDTQSHDQSVNINGGCLQCKSLESQLSETKSVLAVAVIEANKLTSQNRELREQLKAADELAKALSYSMRMQTKSVQDALAAYEKARRS